MLLLTKAGGELQLSPPCRGIRIRLVGFQNPWKFWLWIWNPGLWNPEYNPINRHPANDWTCESKFHWQKIQNPVLSSAIPYSPYVPSLCLSIFCFFVYLSKVQSRLQSLSLLRMTTDEQSRVKARALGLRLSSAFQVSTCALVYR